MKDELDKLRGADLTEVIDFLKREGSNYRLVEVHPPENRQGQSRPGQGSRRFINAVPQVPQVAQPQQTQQTPQPQQNRQTPQPQQTQQVPQVSQAQQNLQVQQEKRVEKEEKAEFIIYYCYERYDYE